MSIRKSVDMGPKGVGSAGPGGGVSNEQDYRFTAQDGTDNRNFYPETNTSWVRFWANWPQIQPSSAPPGGSPGSQEHNRLLSLDQQITAARANGRLVILVSWQYPSWAGGNNGNTMPTDFGPSSPWANWTRFLYQRYRPGGSVAGADIQILEICNEPNYGQPQAPAGLPTVWRRVAQMFQRAQAIGLDYGHSIHLAGPGTADTTSSSSTITPYSTFTDNVLNELSSVGFAGHSRFIWSHHNYRDVEVGYSNRAVAVRTKLQGRWTGYAEGNYPMLFITEGGARLNQIKSDYFPQGGSTTEFEAKQRDLVKANLDRLDPLAGIGMAANYLFFDDSQFSPGYSGLIRPYFGGAVVRRPAFGSPGWSSYASRGVPMRVGDAWSDLGQWYQLDPAILSMRQNQLEWFAIGGDGAVWHRWRYDGGGWGGPESLGGSCATGPAATSRADGVMDVFVVGTDSQMWTTWFNSSSGWAGGWAPLGGTCTSAPAVLSRDPGHLEVFVRSTDNQIWNKWWTASGGWAGGWAPLGGSASSAPAAVSRHSERMDIFALSGNQLWTKWWTAAGGWPGGWAPLGAPPGGCTSSPTACSWSRDRLDVFVRSGDNTIWRRFSHFDRWSAWEPVGPTTVSSAPAAVSQHTGGGIDMIARRGNNMWWSWTYG
jgi:hypothetical protein